MKLSHLCLSLLLAAPAVLADSAINVPAPVMEPSNWRVTFNADFMAGGEELASIEFDDGSSQNVNAGGGLVLGMGLQYRATENIDTEMRISYLFDTANGETEYGDEIKLGFDAFPLDMMAYYHGEKHSIGAGLTYHMNPAFDFNGDVYEFDNAAGMLIEYRYFWDSRTGISVKYQNIEYTLSGTDVTFDGTGFGIGLTFGLDMY
ncbi:hypothetical protein ACQUQU_12280 [Thalassolituus sp. LLYu03]|uniref:hypothetical protein n=1 Tax=Thalassolituus sp. LLYu03 TaxID=3421656 RepID=UPI003D26CBB3